MAPRPAWKGYLKLSLVTCAVELSNATTQSEKVSFRVLNRATGNTVRRQYIDSATGKPVADKNEVRGYEVEKGEFLLVEEDEIEAVQIESSHTLSLDSFVQKSAIQQVYLDAPYYLAPADEVSEEAFAVIREALADKKMAGLARIVLYQRERPVVIEPRGKGMLLTTLHYGNTVRQPETVFDDIKTVKIDKEMIDLATRIIDKKKGKFDPSTFEDRYENALHDLIKAKKAGRKAPVVHAAPKPSNVINLFDALKKSLDADEGGKREKSGAKRAPARRKSPRAKKSAHRSTAEKRKSA
jgi:DNA end-binding protein Ku